MSVICVTISHSEQLLLANVICDYSEVLILFFSNLKLTKKVLFTTFSNFHITQCSQECHRLSFILSFINFKNFRTNKILCRIIRSSYCWHFDAKITWPVSRKKPLKIYIPRAAFYIYISLPFRPKTSNYKS